MSSPAPLRTAHHVRPRPRPSEERHTDELCRVPVLVPVPPLPASTADSEDDIPDPSPGFVRAVAVQGFEVLTGTRSITQLGPLISVGLARHLVALRAVRNDRRIVYRDERRPVPCAGGVRIDVRLPGQAEAAAVVVVGSRAHAVAMRLEWVHRHWRAAELTVL